MSAETVDRWVTRLNALLPWGIIGLMASTAIGDPFPDSIDRLIHQNGAVLLFVWLGVLYMPQLIRAISGQASAMSDLAGAVRDLPRKEDMKFEQILIGQEYLADLVKRLPCNPSRDSCAAKEASHAR